MDSLKKKVLLNRFHVVMTSFPLEKFHLAFLSDRLFFVAELSSSFISLAINEKKPSGSFSVS